MRQAAGTVFDRRCNIGRFLLLARERDVIEWLRPRLEEVRPVDVARSAAGVERCLAGPYTHIGHAVASEVPGGTGLDYLADLRAGNHTVPALLLCLDPPESEHALRASALGALLVDARERTHVSPMVDAVLERFTRRGLAYERQRLGVVPDLIELSDDALTPAELRVAELALENWSRREIAEELGISEKTVASHVTRVLAKCGGTGRRMRWLRERIARRARSRDAVRVSRIRTHDIRTLVRCRQSGSPATVISLHASESVLAVVVGRRQTSAIAVRDPVSWFAHSFINLRAEYS